MLSGQLHDLEDCGMINREVIPEKPPKTIYPLTAFGKSIIPVLNAMCDWGTSYLDGLDIQPVCCPSQSKKIIIFIDYPYGKKEPAQQKLETAMRVLLLS